MVIGKGPYQLAQVFHGEVFVPCVDTYLKQNALFIPLASLVRFLRVT